MEQGIRFTAVVMMAVAASLAFSGPRLSGSVMFAGRVPWDALMVLVLVLSVYVGVASAVPAWSSVTVAVVGLGCLALGSTSQLPLSVGAVLLLVAVADAGWSPQPDVSCGGFIDGRVAPYAHVWKPHRRRRCRRDPQLSQGTMPTHASYSAPVIKLDIFSNNLAQHRHSIGCE